MGVFEFEFPPSPGSDPRDSKVNSGRAADFTGTSRAEPPGYRVSGFPPGCCSRRFRVRLETALEISTIGFLFTFVRRSNRLGFSVIVGRENLYVLSSSGGRHVNESEPKLQKKKSRPRSGFAGCNSPSQRRSAIRR
ncbi:hypothetical protein NL676_037590 [Syzygium grande]|nr:hypothetical protein NL676_037590 [Syzygium grande]